MGNRGSSAISVMAIVLFLTTVFVGLSFFIQTSLRIEMIHKQEDDIKKYLISEARQVVELLSEDAEDRENDNFFQDVWGFVNANENVYLKDVSSYLNPNCIDPLILEHLNKAMFPSPMKLFKDEANYNQNTIKQLWIDEGIQYPLSPAYDDYFEEDILKTFCTPYSYFNFNLCYEYMLEKVCELRTGSENEARRFHDMYAQKILAEKKIIDDNRELENWFTHQHLGGRMFDQLFPIVNVEPAMNVHFMPEEILRGLLSFPPFNIKNHAGIAEQILKVREENEKGLTLKGLKSIIGSSLQYPGKRIYHYLGVFTNFWEIRVMMEESELRWIVARVPQKKATDDIVYKLLEEDIRL
ncbi:MAG: hypothetical protein JW881_09695 [Spirochaetales bacterium]|nr:hypothetical protein [Spirochaetales bacterium]